jgi:hypothetical protein
MLVAFRLNHFVITCVACIYAWSDFINNIYQFSICNGFYRDIYKEDVDEVKRHWKYFFIYKSLSCVPFTVFSSFIVVSLTYRSIVEAFDYIFRKFHNKRQNGPAMRKHFKNKDSFCCKLFDVDDEHEVIFYSYDIEYVLELLENNNTNDSVMKKNFKRTKSKHDYCIEYVELKTLDKKFKIMDKILSGFVKITNLKALKE